jgi:membrane protease YdiL (CAAX protease family)
MSEEREPLLARPLGPMAAAGWSAVFLVTFVLAVSVVASLKEGSDHDGVTLALLYTASGLLTLLFLAWVHAPEAELARLLGARPVRPSSALLSSLMGAAAASPLLALEDLLTRRAVDPQRAAEYARELAATGRTERILGVVAMVLVAPIADELFFRGALFTGVARSASGRRSGLAAALVTTWAFALVSSAGDLRFLPLHLSVGGMLAHARLSTGSVLGALGAQLAYRGVELALALRAHRSLDPLIASTTGAPSDPRALAACVALAALCAVLLHRFGEGEPRDAAQETRGDSP